jgi:hypothetical protein
MIMNQDANYLKILSVFHFIVAGIAGLFACFPIFHLTMDLSMLTGEFFPKEAGAEFPFPFSMFGLMFTLIPAAIILLGWAFAIALAVSGYFLLRKQHQLFCLIMAGISCIFMPFGTVLGVFTIVVLMQPDIKKQFDSTEVAQA